MPLYLCLLLYKLHNIFLGTYRYQYCTQTVSLTSQTTQLHHRQHQNTVRQHIPTHTCKQLADNFRDDYRTRQSQINSIPRTSILCILNVNPRQTPSRHIGKFHLLKYILLYRHVHTRCPHNWSMSCH